MRLMIEVFPAPVAPTIATLSPAEILKSTSRSTQSPSLYANETLSMVISPRTLGSCSGFGGATILGLVSRSRNTRSDEGLADRRVLYFSDRSLVGPENLFTSCPEATSGPIGILPATAP